jgi:4-amino-4-deoxy-L-arabinose transferase-like glycosyltransferase
MRTQRQPPHPASSPSLGRRVVCGIFVLALAVRVAFVLTLGPTLTWDDEREFVAVAHHLTAGEGFVSTSYRANPVLPAYLTSVFAVFGESYAAARIGQALFGALTCVLVALTAAQLAGPVVGCLSGLGLALYLPHVYLSGVFYVECLFTFFIALTVYCAVRALDGARSWSVATGVAFGVAVLTRSVILAFGPFLCAALVLGAAPALRRRQLVTCGALALGAAAVILPWTARNYAVFGKPILVSSGFGTKLWQGNNELAAGDADDRELFWSNEIGRERLAALRPQKRAAVEARYEDVGRRVDALEARLGDRYLASDAVLRPIAFDYMRTHPGRTVTLFAKKLATLLSPWSKTISTNDDTSRPKRLIAAAFYLPVLTLAVAGALLGLRHGRRLAVVYALLGSVAATYALLNTCTRFRLPLDPYLIVFAAIAVAEPWAGRPPSASGETEGPDGVPPSSDPAGVRIVLVTEAPGDTARSS